MSDDVKYIRERVDIIHDRLSDTNAILVVQAKQLEIHIKRTDILEAEVKHVRDHVIAMDKVFKTLGVIIGITVPLLSLVLKFLGKI